MFGRLTRSSIQLQARKGAFYFANGGVMINRATYTSGTVNGITKLLNEYSVDNNQVICTAIHSLNGKNKISLITPKDAWTKEFIITCNGIFGNNLRCGDSDGELMKPPNDNDKCNSLTTGIAPGLTYIQFLKAKTFGVLCDYGTLELPEEVFQDPLYIYLFWPNDAPGDAWNDFMNILKGMDGVVSEIASIADGVVKIGKDAAQIAEFFEE